MRAHSFIPGVCVLLAGIVGGFTLGGFATGGAQASMPDSVAYGSPADTASLAETTSIVGGPDHYSCRGCGPSLAERKAQAYSIDYASVDPGYEAAYDVAKDYSPVPAYQPMPFKGDDPTPLPAL